MRKIATITSLIFLSLALVSQAQMVEDQITMGPGYAYDVFYSMETGEVGQADRSNWDIAFYTAPFSAGIITNGPEGVELYLYPNGDTADWNNIDTTGLSSWPVLYNDQNEWENGAFNRNALGHPDYGWGIYNMVNHDVVSDSIYIIKLIDGSFKKLWIHRKNSINNLYIFEYANLDGSMTVSENLEVNNYVTRNFVYYSMVTGEVKDREPSRDSWDIVFTQYMADQEVGGQYPVTGVLNNVNVAGNMFEEVGPDFDDWTTEPMDTSKVTVGYEWKSFDLGTFSWTVVDSLAYFVQTLEGDIYKLVFTGYEGQGTGVTVFEKMMVSGLGISDPESVGSTMVVGPNPAFDVINVTLPQEMQGRVMVKLYDMSGKTVMQAEVENNVYNVHRLNVSSLEEGTYILVTSAGNTRMTSKVIIRK